MTPNSSVGGETQNGHPYANFQSKHLATAVRNAAPA
ncbi:hypothetical protein OKW35_000028 [Paraburkholderia sp. MM5477-R1]